MLTAEQHQQVFFDFVKGHDELSDLSYTEERREQEIVGLMVKGNPEEDDIVFLPFLETLSKEDMAVVDPNYDELYESFLKIDHNLDSVEYMQSLVEENLDRTRIAKLAVDLIVKPLIESNIDAKTVYFRVKPHWDLSWCDRIIEVN